MEQEKWYVRLKRGQRRAILITGIKNSILIYPPLIKPTKPVERGVSHMSQDEKTRAAQAQESYRQSLGYTSILIDNEDIKKQILDYEKAGVLEVKKTAPKMVKERIESGNAEIKS